MASRPRSGPGGPEFLSWEADAVTMILTDDDVVRELGPSAAIAAARSAVLAAYLGQASAPPRLRARVGDDLDLVVTAGGLRDGPVGMRVYGTWPDHSQQVVVVWQPGGRLQGIVVGAELGTRRTGALGGVAVDALARPDATRAAVIGSGRQAWSQLWAAAAVRPLRMVTVYSPNPAHAAAFADRVVSELSLMASAAPSAEEAVRQAEIILVATASTSPVVAPDALRPGVHVNTVGPKHRDAHELPSEWADRATVVVSDSPAQAEAYPEPFFTQRELVHLGAVLAGDAPGRSGPDDITLYCSTGLAGSEVAIAAALLDSGHGIRLDARGYG
jgi:alanine dehydrogenase